MSILYIKNTLYIYEDEIKKRLIKLLPSTTYYTRIKEKDLRLQEIGAFCLAW